MKAKTYILLFITFFSLKAFALGGEDTTEYNFARSVKAEIERIFLEGQPRYDYDQQRGLVKSWKDRNISAQDMESYMKAYNIAHDLERKIRLSGDLNARGYRNVDFSELSPPLMPLILPSTDTQIKQP